jgi:formate dehydrogenase major subunit
MAITRREFLQYSAATGAGVLFGVFDLKPIVAYAQANPPVWDTLTTSICCYCGVGCGLLVGSPADHSTATYVQGDPDHPINRGTLCSKGQSLIQIRTVDGALNPKRLTGIKYRKPYQLDWETNPSTLDQWFAWDDVLPGTGGLTAIQLLARRIKETRDAANPGYTGNDPNSPQYNTTTEELIGAVMTPVNRCTGVACTGGAALDNEECYLLSKLARSLGIVYLEHQARL